MNLSVNITSTGLVWWLFVWDKQVVCVVLFQSNADEQLSQKKRKAPRKTRK